MSKHARAPAPARVAAPAARAPRSAPPLRVLAGSVAQVNAGTGAEKSSTAVPLRVLRPPPSSARSAHIEDDDAARVALTAWLLHDLAPRLGLDPARIHVSVNREAGQKLDAQQAHGMLDAQRIYLHPAQFDPAAPRGRYLLGHELAHLAQTALPRLHGVDSLARQAAEQEAHAIGRALAADQAVSAPRAWLPAGPAHDVGAGFVASREEVARELRTHAKRLHQRELGLIQNYLKGIVTEGDVFNILALLEPLPFALAQALIASLPPAARERLIANINPTHMVRARRGVLACLANATTARELAVIDLKIFRAIADNDMPLEEQEAAGGVLRRLTSGQQAILQERHDTLVAQRLLSANTPDAAEQERLFKAEREAAKGERLQDDAQQKIRNQQADGKVKAVYQDMLQRLNPSGKKKVAPDGEQALAALDLLAKLPQQDYVPALAQMLDQHGHLLRMLQAIASSNYLRLLIESGAPRQILRKLVQTASPEKISALIQSLLSYGLFDWAVREYELRFAYLLLQNLPLMAQYRFRLQDGGKWYLRLRQKLQVFQIKTEALEVRRAEDKEALAQLHAPGQSLATQTDAAGHVYYSAAQLYQSQVQDKDVRAELEELKRDIAQAKRGKFTAAQAEALFGKLVRLQPASNFRTVLAQRNLVVRELDELGYIDRMFDKLSDDFLFREDHRPQIVQLMLARDPARLLAQARRLLSLRLFSDWRVNDREAWLAQQCLKALPEDERAALLDQDAELRAAIAPNLSKSQQQARDFNAYVGDAQGRDRANVLLQLRRPEVWTEANWALLESLILMAVAISEHAFVYGLSWKNCNGKAPAEIDPKTTQLGRILVTYGLWQPGKSATPRGAGTRLRLQQGGKVGRYIAALKSTRTLLLADETAVQTDIGVVLNAIRGDIEVRQNKAQPGDNLGAITINKQTKTLDVSLPRLVIERVNMQLAGLSLQTGAIELSGLKLHVGFDSSDLRNPLQVRLELAALDVRGIVISKRSSQLAIARMRLDGLDMASNDTSAEAGKSGNGVFALPLPVVPGLWRLIGTGLSLGRGYLGIANRLGGGLNHSLVNDFVDNLRADTNDASVLLRNLTIDGLATSDGNYAGQIQVRNARFGFGRNRLARLYAERALLVRRLQLQYAADPAQAAIDRALLLQRQKAVETEIKQEIQKTRPQGEAPTAPKAPGSGRNNAAAGRLSGPDAAGTDGARADSRQADADNASGVFFDADLVEVQDVRGEVDNQGGLISLYGVHGEGNIGTGKGELIARELVSGPLRVGGGVRTLAALEKRLLELEQGSHTEAARKEYQALLALKPLALEYETLLARGISALHSLELERLQYLRAKLEAAPALTLEGLRGRNIGLRADRGSRQLALVADTLDIDGAALPGSGVRARRLHAANLNLAANFGGNLLLLEKWRTYLQSGQLDASVLQVSGLALDGPGFEVDDVIINNPHAQLDLGRRGLPDGAKPDASLLLRTGGAAGSGLRDSIVVRGANLNFSEFVLNKSLDSLLAHRNEKLTKEEREICQAGIAQIQGLLNKLANLRAAIEQDEAGLKRPGKAAQTARLQQRLQRHRAKLDDWRTQVQAQVTTFDGFALALEGLGDLSAEGAPGQVTEHGFRFHGAGEGGAVLRSFRVQGAGLRQYAKGVTRIGEIQVGALKLSGSYSDRELMLEGEIAGADINQLHYSSPGTDIIARGKARINRIGFDLSLLTPAVPLLGPDPDPKKAAPAAAKTLNVKKITIESISGERLEYRRSGKGETLVLELARGIFKDIALRNLQIDLPASDLARARITEQKENGPTGLHVGAIAGALLAHIGEGNKAGGKLTARDLDLHFINGGSGIDITLAQLRLRANVLARGAGTGPKVTNLNLGGDIRGLQVTILKDGKLIMFNGELRSLTAAGQVGLASGNLPVDAAISRVKSGEGVYEGGRLRLPNVRVGEILLRQLNWQSPGFGVELLAGGSAAMHNAGLGVEVDFNVKPAILTIHNLLVPETTLRQAHIRALVEGKPLTINIGDKPAHLMRLQLKPGKESKKDFSVALDGSKVDGQVLFAGLIAERAAAALKDKFSLLHANLALDEFSLGLLYPALDAQGKKVLKDGKEVLKDSFNLAQLRAEDVAGITSSGTFSVTSPGRTDSDEEFYLRTAGAPQLAKSTDLLAYLRALPPVPASAATAARVPAGSGATAAPANAARPGYGVARARPPGRDWLYTAFQRLPATPLPETARQGAQCHPKEAAGPDFQRLLQLSDAVRKLAESGGLDPLPPPPRRIPNPDLPCLANNGPRFDFAAGLANDPVWQRYILQTAAIADARQRALALEPPVFSTFAKRSGLVVRGIQKDDNGIRVDSAELHGLRYWYAARGISLQFGTINLSAFKMQGSTYSADNLTIDETEFDLADLSKLSDPNAPASPRIGNGFFNFLDRLDGQLNLSLAIEFQNDYINFSQRHNLLPRFVPLRLIIRNGAINYIQLENQILPDAPIRSAAVQEILRLNVVDGQLRVEIHTKRLTTIIGNVLGTTVGGVAGGVVGGVRGAPGGIPGVVLAALSGIAKGGRRGSAFGSATGLAAGKYVDDHYNAKIRSQLGTANMTPEQTRRLEQQGDVNLTSILDLVRVSKKPADESTEEKENSPSAIKSLKVTYESGSLNLLGESVLDLGKLNRGGISGHIRLGKQGKAPMNLLTLEPRQEKDAPDLLRLSVGSLHFSVEDLVIQGDTGIDADKKQVRTDTVISIGEVGIGGLENASLTFSDGEHVRPKTLHGTAKNTKVSKFNLIRPTIESKEQP